MGIMVDNKKDNANTTSINFELFFNESIIPQGLIEVNSQQDGYGFYITQWNSAFTKVTQFKKRAEKIPAQEGFGFLENFNLKPLSLYHNSIDKPEAQFIYHASDKTYKLSLKKLASSTILFALENISDLQFVSSELNEKQRQLKESHEIAHLGYWIENHTQGNSFWSDQVYKILGETPADTQPSFEKYLTFVDKFDRKRVQEAFYNAIETKTGYEITHKLRLKNGAEKYVTQRCYTNYGSDDKPIQSVGIIQDITTFEKNIEELKNSEAIFRSVFNFAPIAIVLVNTELKPLFFNQQFSEIVGYLADKIYQKGLKDFTHPDDYQQNYNQYNQLFNGEIITFTTTKRYIRPDKTVLWAKVIVSAIQNGSDLPEMAIAMVQDISAEKTATEALVKSENQYRTLIENANDGIGLFDREFKPIIFNKVLYGMLNYPVDEYIALDQKSFTIFHPDDRKVVQQAYNSVLQNTSSRIEVRMCQYDGSFKYFALSFIPVIHEDLPAILVFQRSINQRKLAEQQNEEYRLFLETIMDNLPVSLFVKTTPDFRYLYWNRTIEKATGISAEDAIGKTDYDLLPLKAMAEQYHNEDLKLLKQGKKLENEHESVNSYGEINHFNTIKTLHKSNIGNPLILGISMDITRLKDTEKQLEQSTQMLKEAQKIAKLGYWEYDVKRDLFFDNLENRQILGIDKLSYFLNYKQFNDLLHVADQDKAKDSFNRCIQEKISGEGIVRILAGNTTKHIAIKYRAIEGVSGAVEKLRGTCLDITQIRKSEIALRQSEQRLKQAEHIAKVGYWDYDYGTKETKFSDEIWRILELSPAETSVSLAEFFAAVVPEDKVRVTAQFQKSKSSNEPFNLEFKIATHNRNIKFIKTIGTFVRNQDGTMARSVGTFQDISDLKRKEFGHEYSANQLSRVQRIAKIGFVEYNLHSKAITFSDSFSSIFGVTNQSFFNSIDNYDTLIHEEDRLTISKTFEKALKTGQGYNVQYRVMADAGSVKFINEICYFDGLDGERIAIRVIQDISLLKEKDLILEQTSKVQNLMTLGSWELALETMQFKFSKTLLRFFNLPINQDIISYAEFIEMVHTDDRHSVNHWFKKEQHLREDFVLSFRVNAHGQIKFLRMLFNGSNNSDGSTTTLQGIVTDITENRELLNSLYEQTELFKAVAENALFGVVIYQDKKRIYYNKKWAQLIGLSTDFSDLDKSLDELYHPESVAFINDLFAKWEDFNLTEYINNITLKPLNAPEFLAEFYVKELYNINKAVLIIAYPLPI